MHIVSLLLFSYLYSILQYNWKDLKLKHDMDALLRRLLLCQKTTGKLQKRTVVDTAMHVSQFSKNSHWSCFIWGSRKLNKMPLAFKNISQLYYSLPFSYELWKEQLRSARSRYKVMTVENEQILSVTKAFQNTVLILLWRATSPAA